MKSYERIAKILRSDRDAVRLVEERFSVITGKKNVMDKIMEENEAMMKNRLNDLNLKTDVSAKTIYDALIKKISADNELLKKALKLDSVQPDYSDTCRRIIEEILKLEGAPRGFFLKKERAVEFLKSEPPQKIIKSLGYRDVNELLEKEDVYEIFSALRFLEDTQWLNEIFFRQYEKLKPSDFEEREIVLKVLPVKWTAAAQSFVKKKYHNISHLKEMGMIFVIPISLGISGELMRTFILILHYLNEIPFYSDLFRRFSFNSGSFASNIISLLRGDVLDKHLPPNLDEGKSNWIIIQRYLAKDDENDWRLFEPHLNPEALHWERAERILVKAGETLGGFSRELSFWKNLNWVGDYYKSDVGIDVLASFNLVDTAMSLVMEKEMIKYLYHHQESLWNKIFVEYFSEEEMEKFMKENIIKGWFEI